MWPRKANLILQYRKAETQPYIPLQHSRHAAQNATVHYGACPINFVSLFDADNVREYLGVTGMAKGLYRPIRTWTG